MKWSRYSRLFESRRNGWLLFSASTGAFLRLKDEQVPVIKGIMEDPEGYDYANAQILYMQLRSLGFLVDDLRDDEIFNILKMKRLTGLYADRSLSITFALTKACNFDCSYCFEKDHTGSVMDQETEDAVMDFIRCFKTDTVHVTWYGGEPLLAFDRMISINRRLRDMGKQYEAIIVTNGYLMTKERAERFNDLKIGLVQITLDGRKETHDKRRYLKGGGETYDTILKNIDDLMETDFKGRVNIRVNVDGRNTEEFIDVYNMLKDRYGTEFGRRITAYPGFVKGEMHPDRGCFLDQQEQGAFLAEVMEKHHVAALNIYPNLSKTGCVLTSRNAYVIGPEGEIYKCWDDVGDKDRVVGSVKRLDNWKMGVIAEGIAGCSYLDDPECRECFYFPVCDGGCHRIRQNNLKNREKKSTCSYFKGNIEELLELFYEDKKRRAEERKKTAGQEEACRKAGEE